MKVKRYTGLYLGIVIIILSILFAVSARSETPPPIVKDIEPEPAMTIEQEVDLMEYINETMTEYIMSPRHVWCYETDRSVCSNQENINDMGDIAQKYGWTLSEFGIAAQLLYTDIGLRLSIQAVFLSKVIEGERHIHIWNLDLLPPEVPEVPQSPGKIDA
jgi:hypothetical protein